MKKVTIVLSMFVCALSSQTFAQDAPNSAPVKVKAAAPRPGETGYQEYKMKDILISSAQPKTAPKPSTKTKAVAVPAPKPTPILMPLLVPAINTAKNAPSGSK